MAGWRTCFKAIVRRLSSCTYHALAAVCPLVRLADFLRRLGCSCDGPVERNAFGGRPIITMCASSFSCPRALLPCSLLLPLDLISSLLHLFRENPDLLLSKISRQLKTPGVLHFTGKGDQETVDNLLQSFQSKIKESLREARRRAWNQELQADPRSESYKNARKANMGGRKTHQENEDIKAERKRKMYEEEATLLEMRERWVDQQEKTHADFEGQGVRPKDIQQDQLIRAGVRPEDIRQELATTTQFL